jgi:hypothetical protein
VRSNSTLALIASLLAAFAAGSAWADSATSAAAELDIHVTTVQRAIASGDRDGAVRAFDAIATFYRRGGDMASAAAADLEAARLLFAQERYDDAFALLERSEGTRSRARDSPSGSTCARSCSSATATRPARSDRSRGQPPRDARGLESPPRRRREAPRRRLRLARARTALARRRSWCSNGAR